MRLGYIGLGRMGRNMVLRLLSKGIKVVAWNRSPEPLSEVVGKGAVGAKSIEDLVSKLTKPRIVWLMLPAGEVTDEFIHKLLPLLGRGDLIVDGGNSFYKDTLRRTKQAHQLGINYMDIGVSGGPEGAKNGACLMVGGNPKDYKKVLPIVKAASSPQAYGYFGPVGSGHFGKMVHNGIEYGMMEAIAEGASILKNAPFQLDLAEVFRVYNNRSVIESRLVGWIREALLEDDKLLETSSVIGSTGEGAWTVDTAKELGIKVPIIEGSLKVRYASEKDPENSPEGYRNKVVSAMRGKFGQHKVKKG